MVKILIICRKNETSKALINHVISKISLLRLVGISNTESETLALLEEKKPNLIISSNKNIILLIKRNFKHYTPGIILLSKKTEELPYFYKHLLVLQYNLNFELMEKRIRDFITDFFRISKKEQLKKILLDLGFNLKLNGSLYLTESILYANTCSGSGSFENLEKDIYSYVAKKYNVTPKRIKWAIERSINYMYQNHTPNSYFYIEKYLAIEYPKKPTPKLIINTISNLLVS